MARPRKQETTGAGHNSLAPERLASLVQRIERLEEEKKALSDDIKDIFEEAKSAGFDTKVLRALIRERRTDESERAEHEALLDTYRAALAGLVGTPLGEAALARVA